MWRNKKPANQTMLVKQGYTIVEAMIFLAVSTALLLGALTMVGGQRDRTEFTQAVRDLETRIQDIFNDVATGFYPDMGIGCQTNGSVGNGILLSSGSPNDQGAREDCIFVGRVMQFAPGPDRRGTMMVYTAAGQRLTLSGVTKREVTSLTDAKPLLIAKSHPSDSAPDAIEQINLGPMEIRSLRIGNSGPSYGGFGIFTTFASYSGNNLASGSSSANLVVLKSTALLSDTMGFTSSSNGELGAGTYELNPTAGVTICMDSTVSNQHAVMTIGGNRRQMSTLATINNGSC